MDRKKLETRIRRLEKLVYSKIKNESVDTDLHDLAKEIEIAIKSDLRNTGWVVASRVKQDAYEKDFIRLYIEGDDYEISKEHCLLFKIYVNEDRFEIVDDFTVHGHTYRARNINELASIITRLVNNYFAEQSDMAYM